MGLSLPWAVAVHPYDAGDPRQDQWSSGKYTFADLSNIASYLCGRLGMLGVGESLPSPGNDWPFRPQATLYASEQGWCYGCHGCKEDCRGRNICLAQELSEKCPNVIAVTHNYFQQVPGGSQGGQTYGLIAGHGQVVTASQIRPRRAAAPVAPWYLPTTAAELFFLRHLRIAAASASGAACTSSISSTGSLDSLLARVGVGLRCERALRQGVAAVVLPVYEVVRDSPLLMLAAFALATGDCDQQRAALYVLWAIRLKVHLGDCACEALSMFAAAAVSTNLPCPIRIAVISYVVFWKPAFPLDVETAGDAVNKAIVVQWRRSCTVWRSRFPWLQAVRRRDTGHLRFGCLACRAAGQRGPFGEFRYARFPMIAFLFSQHERGPFHQAAEQFLFHFESGATTAFVDESLAPSLAEFREVRDAIRERTSATNIARSKKLRKFGWCLDEAGRELDRKFLVGLRSGTLLQDVRNGRLLVRFKGSNRELSTRSGVLAQVRTSGDSTALKDATVDALLRACTVDHAAPFSTRRGRVHTKLFKRLIERFENFVADAAADEQRAGRLLQKQELPGLKLILKDITHATRRLVKRPWAADPYLKAVVGVIVLEKKSITQLIQHSYPFAAKFRRHIQKSRQRVFRTARVRNLRIHKARFDSTSKPIGRAVIYMDSLVDTAIEICDERAKASVEHRSAAIFLEFLDEEVCLQLACVADGGDEALLITRRSDRENFDVCTLPYTLKWAVHKLSILFGDEALCWKMGYGKFMLAFLQHPRCWISPVTGEAKMLGGSDRIGLELKDRVRGRMRNWVRLLVQTVHAEFPNFDIVHRMEALYVGAEVAQLSDKRMAENIRGLRAIAAFLQVSEDDAVHDFQHLWSAAHAKQVANPLLPTHAVWALTVNELRECRPISAAFQRCLEYVSGFSGSTSGVEQNFSAAQWASSGTAQISKR